MLYDVVMRLASGGVIDIIDGNDEPSSRIFKDARDGYIGRKVDQAFKLESGIEAGKFTLSGEDFFYEYLRTGSEYDYFLIKREHCSVRLYERALDMLADGIQIYDKNACVVYINKVSRRISAIPERLNVGGKHLLDMYALNEDISTVLTSLRTQAPVINRVDTFKSALGANITTANTAYPLFEDQKLIGSVAFEQNVDVVKIKIEQLQDIRDALTKTSMQTSMNRFTGYTFENIIGNGEKLAAAVALSKRVAMRDCSVLLTGETGTGKEIFAQSIHRASLRRSNKFLAINCAAVPENLIEGLFFGTVKGSFTGSVNKSGYLEEADGGTLFLDELNSMSLSMQSKILRVIQEGVFRRVGGEKDIKIDIRIISSCNEDPFLLVEKNILRKDLFYRLSAVLIETPPLREHIEDVDELVAYYISEQSGRYIKSIQGISPEVAKLFKRYPWPGNVRELFHVLDHILNVVDGGMAEVYHLPRYLRESAVFNCTPEAERGGYEGIENMDLRYIMDSYEAGVLDRILEHHGYNISKTASALGISRQSLQYRVRKYRLVF